jgi:hypothetical protein
MKTEDILLKQRDIWWNQKLTLSEIIIRLWKVFWDLCRWERDAIKDKDTHTDEDLKKELWNIIISTTRWCDDLWYDPEDCINIAFEAQKRFKK